MILGISIVLTLIACIALFLVTEFGILAIYFARPFVDTQWDKFVFVGFKLTELISVLVPLITIVIVLINIGTKKSVTKMPLFKFWMFYLFYIICFSVNIGINSTVADGASVLFRYMNGFVGFYLVQAYFRNESKMKVFFLVLALAGIFPVAQGVFEAITGIHWSITTAEGQIRNIGMYHDAITIRYYGLQTLLAVAACIVFEYPKVSYIRVFLWALLFGSLAIVYKALSKSGLMTLALWSAVWSYGRRSWVFPSVILLAVLIAVPIFFNEISTTVFNQFHKEIGAISGDVAANRTFAGRWYIWDQLWKEWAKFTVLQKMFGSGKAAFGAHNDYMQMLFSGGYVGLALYLYFLGVVGWNLVRIYLTSRHILGTLALMAFIMWMIDSIGLVPSLYSGYQWFVWGIISLCMRYDSDQKIIRKKEIKKMAANDSVSTESRK
jgi:O-antigen ligase